MDRTIGDVDTDRLSNGFLSGSDTFMESPGSSGSGTPMPMESDPWRTDGSDEGGAFDPTAYIATVCYTPPNQIRNCWSRRQVEHERLERLRMSDNDPMYMERRRESMERQLMDKNDGWFEIWLVSIMD